MTYVMCYAIVAYDITAFLTASKFVTAIHIIYEINAVSLLELLASWQLHSIFSQCRAAERPT